MVPVLNSALGIVVQEVKCDAMMTGIECSAVERVVVKELDSDIHIERWNDLASLGCNSGNFDDVAAVGIRPWH